MAPIESTTLTAYVQSALASSSEHPVLAFPKDPHGANNFRRYNVAELKRLADQAAAQYASYGLKPRQKGEMPLIVGLFAPGDILWVATFLAVLQMGHTFLVLSSKLPDETISALLDKAECDMLIHDRRPKLSNTGAVVAIPICTLTNATIPATTDATQFQCDPAIINPEKDMAWIPHSSGSTGIPKLFKETQAHVMRVMRMLRDPLFPSKSSWVASAAYNTLGVRIVALSLAKTSGPSYFDNDRVPFTAQRLEQFLLEARPQVVFATPYALGLLPATEKGMSILRASDHVKLFGAVLSKSVGDTLVMNGVHLASEYGLSEGGAVLTSNLRSPEDKDWDYLMPTSAAQAKYLWFKPLDQDVDGAAVRDGEQLHELVITQGSPAVLGPYKDADGNLPTGDLFLKHPTKEDRWKIMGRKDDQLKIYEADRQVLVNALEYENLIKAGNEDVVEEAVLFGQGKPRVGVLIFTANRVDKAADGVLEKVWTTIDTHVNPNMKVKVSKDMIKIITDGAELPRTPKFNFVRPLVYERYASVIEDAYRMN